MIYSDSRYATGVLFKAYDAKRETHSLTLFRSFPVETSNFYYYFGRERDRIEAVAASQLGDSSFWWRIMDYNPEIIDPINIPVGTALRIPYAD